MTRPRQVVRPTAPDRAQLRLQMLIPPFAMALSLTTAVALLLVAATLAPWPTGDGRVASPMSPEANVAASPTVSTTRLAQTTSVPLPPEPVLFGLARLEYPPGAGGTRRPAPGPLLFVVEAGALAVDLTGSAEIARADGTKAVAADATLHPGDRLLLADAGQFAVHNDGATAALAVEAGVFPVGTPPAGPPRLFAMSPTTPQWADAWSPGAIVQAFAGGWLMTPPRGPATVTLSRLSLPPGANVALSPTSGRALGVEAGALTLTLTGGIAWMQTPDGTGRLLDEATGVALPPADAALVQAGAAALLPGDGALIQNAANVSLGNDGDGPLLMLLLTIGPAGDDATPGVV